MDIGIKYASFAETGSEGGFGETAIPIHKTPVPIVPFYGFTSSCAGTVGSSFFTGAGVTASLANQEFTSL